MQIKWFFSFLLLLIGFEFHPGDVRFPLTHLTPSQNLAEGSQQGKRHDTLHQQAHGLVHGNESAAGLASRVIYWEELPNLLIRAAVTNRKIQVVHFKIRGFKEFFNELAKKNSFYEYLGDETIRQVGQFLKMALQENLVKGYRRKGIEGVDFYLYNRGPAFFLVFLTPQSMEQFSLKKWLEAFLNNQDFKDVITEVTKQELRGIDEVATPRQGINLERRLQEIQSKNLLLYGGLSEKIQVNPDILEISPEWLLQIREQVDRQAQYSAKVAQLLADPDFSKIWSESLQLIHSHLPRFVVERLVGKKWKNYITPKSPGDPSLARSIQIAQITPKTQLLYWDKAMEQLIGYSREFGVSNVFEEFYTPKQTQAQEEPFTSLFHEYRSKIDQGDWGQANQSLHKLIEKIVNYNSDSPGIFRGKEFCYLMVNYIIRNYQKLPQNWRTAFRMGGDELVRLDWQGENGTENLILSSYYGDIHHLGDYNFQWGHELGDKILEETVRILFHTEDPREVPRKIYSYFKDGMDRPLVLEKKHHIVEKLNQRGYLGTHGRFEGNHYLLYRIPPVKVNVKVTENLNVAIESYPMFTLGGLKIHMTSLAADLKEKELKLDFSKLLGRAFTAASVQKGRFKQYQGLHNGLPNPNWDEAYQEATPILHRGNFHIEGMEEKKFSELQVEIARWIWQEGLLSEGKPLAHQQTGSVESAL